MSWEYRLINGSAEPLTGATGNGCFVGSISFFILIIFIGSESTQLIWSPLTVANRVINYSLTYRSSPEDCSWLN